MKIKLHNITIKELVENYTNNGEEGVFGYNNKLNIRPKYQREFVYNEKQTIAVINTVIHKYPLNVMYWSKTNDEEYEIIDGQQRTIAIAEFIKGQFTYKNKFFANYTTDQKENILNYKLNIYICSGTETEKLKWFETINIAGEKLTNQELRNAVFAGKWTIDAKRRFSKKECPAQQLAHKYLNKRAIRQEYLETAIKWISENKIEEYMGKHQNDDDAHELWDYFRFVIEWIERTFTQYRKIMEKVEWGYLYNKYKNEKYNPKEIEQQTQKLIEDEEITNQSGIYPYILTKDEKYLNIRTFTQQTKQRIYEKQNGICKNCNDPFKIEEMESDHITPWCEGGKTNEENCQMLCIKCNRKKSNK